MGAFKSRFVSDNQVSNAIPVEPIDNDLVVEESSYQEFIDISKVDLNEVARTYGWIDETHRQKVRSCACVICPLCLEEFGYEHYLRHFSYCKVIYIHGIWTKMCSELAKLHMRCIECEERFKNSADFQYHIDKCKRIQRSSQNCELAKRIEDAMVKSLYLDKEIDRLKPKFVGIGKSYSMIYALAEANWNMYLWIHSYQGKTVNELKDLVLGPFKPAWKDSCCLVCADIGTNTRLYPCGHKCICFDCVSKVTKCPACYTTIINKPVKADSSSSSFDADVKVSKCIKADSSSSSSDADVKVSECVICQDAMSNTTMIPCGHLCACFNCASKVKICPICRADIVQIVKVYFS